MNADEDTYDIKQPGTKNEYVYGVNNPVMNVDPNGRFYVSTILSGLVRGILAYIVINNMIGPSWSTFFGKEVDFARRGMILSFTKGFVNTHRGRDDCEAMVEIYKYAGMLYGGGTNEDEYRFVNELEAILTPHDGPMALLTREQNSRPKYYSGDVTNITPANEFFYDEGFAEEFRDRSNQVQHFTAFFAIGYFWGPGKGSAAVYYNEVRTKRLRGLNPFDEDIMLGFVGLNLGYVIRHGIIGASIRNLWSHIEFSVCEDK